VVRKLKVAGLVSFVVLIIRNSKIGLTRGHFISHAYPYCPQACRDIHTTAVVRKLKAAGLMEFSGTLRPSTEPLAPALIAPLLPPLHKAYSSNNR